MAQLGLLEGVLKQQCIDENGLYVWLRKTCLLDVSKKVFYIKQDEADDPAGIFLHGAKYAKEWSFSSALAGFGFDLVWSSGKIWSFLVDNEQSCKHWVDSFNTSLSSANLSEADESHSFGSVTNKPPRHPAKQLDNQQITVAAASLSATIDHVNHASSYISNSNSNSSNNSSSNNSEGSMNDTQLEPASSPEYEQQYSCRSDGELPKTAVKHAQLNRSGIEAALMRSTREAEQRGILQYQPQTQPQYQLHPQSQFQSQSHDSESESHAYYSDSTEQSSDKMRFQPATTAATAEEEVREQPLPLMSPPPPPSLSQLPQHQNAFANKQEYANGADTISIWGVPYTISYPHSNDRIADKIFSGQPFIPPTTTTAAITATPAASTEVAATVSTTAATAAAAPEIAASESSSTAAHEVRKAIERATLEIEQHAATPVQGRDVVGDIYEDAELAKEAVAASRRKCEKLEATLNRKQQEISTLKERVNALEDRVDEITLEYEKQLDAAKERERAFIKDSKREIDGRLLRVSNENASFFEASAQQLKLQHDREMACLREQMEEERKLHMKLYSQAQELKDRAEKTAVDGQHELGALKDKYTFIESEYKRAKRELEVDRGNWERERNRLIAESENAISALHEEKDAALLHSHQEMKRKVAEMNEKMSRSLVTLQEHDRETLRQEIEGNHLRSLAEMQKKCQREIESVRTEERRLAAVEINNVRSAFVSREHQTSEDLIQLEKLHAIRVTQLEQQLIALKAQQAATEEKLVAASHHAAKGNISAQRHAEQLKEAVQGSAIQAEHLHHDLVAVHQELQESKLREASYREQLSQALNENRLQRAELLEMKEQAASGTAQAYQWRKASKESEVSITAAERTVQICKDEVAMLEHALRRKEDENAALRRDLKRSDRLIYGVPQHEPPDENFNRTYEMQMQPSCLFDPINHAPILTDVPVVSQSVDYIINRNIPPVGIAVGGNNSRNKSVGLGVANTQQSTPQRWKKGATTSTAMQARRVLRTKTIASTATNAAVTAPYTPVRSTPYNAHSSSGGSSIKLVPKHTVSSSQKLRAKQ